MELEVQELALIEHALRKFQQETYGLCENCGRQISFARLEVLPYARYCVRCQRKLEECDQSEAWHPANWERVYEMERRYEEPEVDFSRLEAERR